MSNRKRGRDRIRLLAFLLTIVLSLSTIQANAFVELPDADVYEQEIEESLENEEAPELYEEDEIDEPETEFSFEPETLAETLKEENNSEEEVQNPPEVIHDFINAVSRMDAGAVFIDIVVRINSTETPGTVAPGKVDDVAPVIAPNITFKRAVVRSGGYDAQIAYVGIYDGYTYFSLDSNPNVGILLGAGEQLVFSYESRYEISYQIQGNGHVGDAPMELSGGANLYLTVYPDAAHRVMSVTATDSGGIITNIVLDNNNYAELEVNDDIIIKIVIEPTTYHVIQGQVQQGYICCDNMGFNDNCSHDDGLNYKNIQYGETAEFIFYTHARELLNYDWELNQLSINGVELRLPAWSRDATATTVLPNGSVVTVQCLRAISTVNLAQNVHDSHYYGSISGWLYAQSKYKVTVTNVQEDLVINMNCKNSTRDELIVKGLHGIGATGFGNETRYGLAPYSYRYSLEQSDIHVYGANTYSSTRPSINLVTYAVKPGYNPWTVSVEGVNTGDWQPLSTSLDPTKYIFYTEESELDKINSYRTWTTFANETSAAGLTHAFYFPRSSSSNQQVYLNASVYHYQMQFDLNGGTLGQTPDGYGMISSGRLAAIERYNVENHEPFYMIDEIPVRNGYIFSGWRLQGSLIDYATKQKFDVTTETAAHTVTLYTGNTAHGYSLADTGDLNSNNNRAFVFVAQWTPAPWGMEETDIQVKYYLMDPDTGDYTEAIWQQDSATGTVGSDAVYTVPWNPGAPYVLNETKSTLIIRGLKPRTTAGYLDFNTISYYYDYQTSYVVHYYKDNPERTPLSDDRIVNNKGIGSTVTETAKEITGYSPDTAVKSVVLEKEGNEITFLYTANNYTLYFDANDGIGTMIPMNLTYDESEQLSLNTFTKSGYQFAGWSTVVNGPMIYRDGDVVLNLTAVKDGSVTLYAVWEERLNVTVPLYVCMYGYGGDGTVVTPGNYGIINYSDCNIRIEKLTVDNMWTLVSEDSLSGGNKLKAGELYMQLFETTLKPGDIDTKSDFRWQIEADDSTGNGRFLSIPVRAYIAAGAQVETDEYQVVNVHYTIGRFD